MAITPITLRLSGVPADLAAARRGRRGPDPVPCVCAGMAAVRAPQVSRALGKHDSAALRPDRERTGQSRPTAPSNRTAVSKRKDTWAFHQNRAYFSLVL